MTDTVFGYLILISIDFYDFISLEARVVSSLQSNTVILPPISQTTCFFKPIFVWLGGLKNRDSTEYVLNQQQQHARYYQNREIL